MKAVLNRKKSASVIVSASERWAAATAERLAELLRQELRAGETLPDMEVLQQLLGRALARRWQRLERADQARQRATEHRQRRGREKTAARDRLYRRVVDLRKILRGVFGDAPSRRLLGIVGETSRDAMVLLRQAHHTVARLRVAPRDLPTSSFELTADDLTRWCAPVEAAADDLRSATSLATAGGKDFEAASAELRRAIADFDAVFVRVASMLRGIYTGADRDQRADTVRPSKRRLGRLLEDDDRAPKTAPASAALSSPTMRRGRTRVVSSEPALPERALNPTRPPPSADRPSPAISPDRPAVA